MQKYAYGFGIWIINKSKQIFAESILSYDEA